MFCNDVDTWCRYMKHSKTMRLNRMHWQRFLLPCHLHWREEEKKLLAEIQVLKKNRSKVNQVQQMEQPLVLKLGARVWYAEIAEELDQLWPWHVHEGAESGHQPGQRHHQSELIYFWKPVTHKMTHDKLNSTMAPARDKFLLVKLQPFCRKGMKGYRL